MDVKKITTSSVHLICQRKAKRMSVLSRRLILLQGSCRCRFPFSHLYILFAWRQRFLASHPSISNYTIYISYCPFSIHASVCVCAIWPRISHLNKNKNAWNRTEKNIFSTDGGCYVRVYACFFRIFAILFIVSFFFFIVKCMKEICIICTKCLYCSLVLFIM